MTEMTIKYHFGIDGGGTGCRAVIADQNGKVLGEGISGPANIGADSENSIVHICEAAEQARKDASLASSIYGAANAVLGLAGANSLADHTPIYKRLPFKKSHIVSDTLSALQGAMGDGDAAIAILGTGSAFVRRTDDAIRIVGGRGFILSDHAGGAWLGRKLLENVLLAVDGFAHHSDLSHAVLERFDSNPRNITVFSRTASAADYAAFAPMLFEFAARSDSLSLKILTEACEMIRKALENLQIEKLQRFSITGGLASPYAALPFFPYREFYKAPSGDSLQGALALALKTTLPT
ncbi:ATPase [Brucella sp. HL-2]|nr:BadF/BadG/BcrA/BcrD ATPase family protein [Brucella sp. HL-2]MCV9908620.1 ATPase [Brucella sp. HL-2]